ncbi:PREDICTED: MYCBP-associated protein-like [Priapulus caudatus]|uniref:MYCBP-associated protein-like n=1 Tax=Priapulus caudatus TaxID=37621 RepID=A0ABM1EG79_PRICU|nr:PREDICTED: MYCBP-associated protein-like [Priapulus caudatus]
MSDGAAVQSTRGVQLDSNGRVIPHSILGSIEEYLQQMNIQADVDKSPKDQQSEAKCNVDCQGPGVVAPPAGKPLPQGSSTEDMALNRWKQKMEERINIQRRLGRSTDRSLKELLMNQADSYRAVQEQRQLMDRVMPAVDQGKGYRVGSEFWNQQERIGDDIHGIHTTLTTTERGCPPPLELLGYSKTIQEEMGIRKQTTPQSWQESKYLKNRKEKLRPLLARLLPHQPEFPELEVIGTGDVSLNNNPATDTVEEEELLEAVATEDTLEKQTTEVLKGPALKINAWHVRWSGHPTTEAASAIGLQERLVFEATAGDKCSANVNLSNDGCTAIYYSWKRVPKETSFGIKPKSCMSQCFYFNTSDGSILPGEVIDISIYFKSSCAGIFSETWELVTVPVLGQGARLHFILTGIATQEDLFKEERDKILGELEHRQAVRIAGDMIDSILLNVNTPERPQSPADAYLTLEDRFSTQNPRLFYKHQCVDSLNEQFLKLVPDKAWDASLMSLRKVIMELEDDEQRSIELEQMNNSISELCFRERRPVMARHHQIAYQLLVETIDAMVHDSCEMRRSMGLPDRGLPEQEASATDMNVAGGGSGATMGKGKAGKVDNKKETRKGGKAKIEPAKPKSAPATKKGTPPAQAPPVKVPLVLTDGKLDQELGSQERIILDPVLEENYRERIHIQTYHLISSMFDKLTLLLDDGFTSVRA